jgi:glycosyltransferase involved in cell wall biosynthesis
MVSVSIPTLNEEKALPLALAHVLVQPSDYEGSWNKRALTPFS